MYVLYHNMYLRMIVREHAAQLVFFNKYLERKRTYVYELRYGRSMFISYHVLYIPHCMYSIYCQCLFKLN